MMKKALFTLLFTVFAATAAHANAASCWLSYQGDECRTCCSDGYDTCHEAADFQLFGDPCIPYYLICLDGCRDAQQAAARPAWLPPAKVTNAGCAAVGAS